MFHLQCTAIDYLTDSVTLSFSLSPAARCKRLIMFLPVVSVFVFTNSVSKIFRNQKTDNIETLRKYVLNAPLQLKKLL